MHRLICLILLLSSTNLLANERERLAEAAFSSSQQIADSRLQRQNQTVFNYLWVDVYAAALYTDPGISPRQAVGHEYRQRLELYYFRAIDRQDVIKAAWVALKRQHPAAQLARLRTEIDALHATFADIQAGDRYALDYSSNTGISLLINGRQVFNSRNTELAHAYLGIWLADNGLSASLREQLLGTAPPQAARVLSQ